MTTLGTLTFLDGGEYYGLDVRSDNRDTLLVTGLATSFVHTRQVRLELTGDLIPAAHAAASDQLAGSLGALWGLDGEVAGRPGFPFLECETVELPGSFGALIRMLSEYGEQRCLYLTGCADRSTVGALVACSVVAVALPIWAGRSDGAGTASANAEIHMSGNTVRGGLSALWQSTS